MEVKCNETEARFVPLNEMKHHPRLFSFIFNLKGTTLTRNSSSTPPFVPNLGIFQLILSLLSDHPIF